jgi:hypothetical protein
MYRQGKYMSVLDYYLEEFSAHQDMVEHCNGQIGGNPCLIDRVLRDMEVEQENATNEQLHEAVVIAQEEYAMVVFLVNSHRT